MAFTRFLTSVNNHQSLPDKPRSPTYTATALKVLYDKAPNDIKTYVNSILMVELESTTDGNSGADNVGATPITGGVANTVQGILEELDTVLDNVVLGQIPDGSLMDVKLSNALGQTKDMVSKHTRQISDLHINIKDFGAICDGIADDTIAFQSAFDYAYANGKSIFVPAITRITGKIGISISLTTQNSFPSIFGIKAMALDNTVVNPKVQNGSIILCDGVNAGLQIKSTDASKIFYGSEIRNISILGKNAIKPTDGSIGLDMQGCVDYRMYNVFISGFDIGYKTYDCYSWDTFGLTVVQCNIGAKLDRNSNACGMHGTQCHQNNVGIKIIGGLNILISRITLESCVKAGIVVTADTIAVVPRSVYVINPYFEGETTGIPFKIGKNEDDVVSSAVIHGFKSENITFYNSAGIVPIQLDKTVNIEIGNHNWLETTPMVSTTVNTKYVSINNPNDASVDVVSGTRYATDRRIGYDNKINLINNGYLQFPNLSDYAGIFTAVYDDTTFSGERVVKITIPTGTSNDKSITFPFKVNKNLVGKRMNFSAFAQSDSGLTSKIKIYPPTLAGGTELATIDVSTTMSLHPFNFTCGNYEYMVITITLTNSSGSDKNLYIKSMVLCEEGFGQLSTGSVEYLSGLSGSKACVTTGTVITLVGYETDMYEVIVTPQANVTAYVTKASQQFTITTVGGNATVSYMIIPKCGMAI